MAQNAQVGEVFLDRTTNRIVMRMEMDVTDVGKVRGMSVGFIGAKGLTFLHCYAPDAEFNQRMPAFQSIVDSFRYDAGYEFVPRQGPSFQSIVLIAGGVCGMIGLFLGALGGGVFWLLRRSKKAN